MTDSLFNSTEINLLSARSQMAVSLGFHIIFAAIGMVMPFFMAVAHWKWLRTKQNVYLELTKAWSKGFAIFFAVGAVSGTVLSFELGLLWPGFMKHAGAIIGLPFSLEGVAFFLEAIALGIFLYGWNKIPPWLHWISVVVVGISGLFSGLIVICANGWMNAPTGFQWVNGHAINIDPYAAMLNKAAFWQGMHMLTAAFSAVGFAVAGVHAWRLLKKKNNLEFHRKGFIIAMIFASVFSLIQPLGGDFLAKRTAQLQPIKLAAMESLFDTQKGAPLLIGGIPSEKTESVTYGIHIPRLLSFLSYSDFNAEVKGLKDFPKKEWPPVLPTHLSFQIMVALGSFLAVLSAVFLALYWKKSKLIFSPLFLKIIFLSVPLGFIAIEAGWVVTEVGRQPWIIYKIMKTKDSLTPIPGLFYTFCFITALYLFLSFFAVWLLARQIQQAELRVNK